MRPLATNIVVWQGVKPGIQWGLSVLPIGLTFAAFVPIMSAAKWLAGALDLGGGPVKGQSNGLLWFALFLATMLVLMLAGYVLGWVLNAAIVRMLFGWSGEKIRDVFLESKVPAEWRQPATAPDGTAVRRTGSWAVTRQKGRWNFVLTRGVLGWGGAMYVVTGVMPVLTNRHEPSFPYFVSQALLWAAGGAFFGLGVWSWNEWLFKRQSARSDKEDPSHANVGDA